MWWALGGTIALDVVCLVLTRLNRLTPERYVVEFIISSVLGSLSFVIVGALITLRRPDNRVGWLLSAAGFSTALTVTIQQLTRYTLVTRPGSLPGAEFLGWLNLWLWVPQTALFLLYLPLLFPNGQLPSPRWRWAIWVSAAAVAAVVMVVAISPGPVDDSLPEVNNPYVPAWSAQVLPWLEPMAAALILITMAATAVAPLYRMAHTQGLERQQTRVFAIAAGVMSLAFLIPIIIYYPNHTWLSGLMLTVGIPILPIGVGMAVLRYRLYDIDIIARRTLIYFLLSLLLVLGYYACVIVLQSFIRAVSGANNSVAVVISTLLMALLFNPLRLRTQRVIDRLFYRQKYDPSRVLSDFSGAVRSEVDLNRLAGMLVEQVEETMHPENVSLWMVRWKREEGAAGNERLEHR